MGKSHALSGALGWLSACAGAHALATAGTPMPEASPQAVAVGTVVCAGYALLPDIDHPQSTIARALGPLTGALSWLVTSGASALRTAGCAHCASGPGRGGHRAITHTFAFALALTVVLELLLAWRGQQVGLVVAGVGVWLATYAGLRSRVRAQIVDAFLPGRPSRSSKAAHRVAGALGSLIVTGLAVIVIGDVMAGRSWWWVALAAGTGTFIHSLGDSMTRSGSPLWWPIAISGCRWRSVGTPRWVRFTTGQTGEKVVVLVMVALVIAATVYLTYDPASPA